MAGRAVTARCDPIRLNLQSFYAGCARPASKMVQRSRGRPRPMLDWLVSNSEVLGLSGQNWMWLIGGALLLYVAMLLVTRSRHTHLY
jgi:hypothetical protein